MHDDTILDTIVTNRVLDEEGRCHPQQKDRAPFPRPLCCRWTAPALLVTVGARLGHGHHPHPPLLSTTTTTKSTETDCGLCLRLPPMMSRGARGATDAAGGDDN